MLTIYCHAVLTIGFTETVYTVTEDEVMVTVAVLSGQPSEIVINFTSPRIDIAAGTCLYSGSVHGNDVTKI